MLYNGNNGLSYNTTDLVATIPNQQAGFGTTFVSYPANGIPERLTDGIALVDPGNTAVQFLSYEGSFVAPTARPAG